MREVSCRAARMVLEVLEDARISTEGLADGLPVSLAHLYDASARIDWNVYAEFLARVEERCGERLSPEEIGTRILKVPSFDVLRRASKLLFSPRHLFAVGNRLVAPAMFSNVIVRGEWLPSGRYVITGELLAGYRESTTFFRICHANIAAVPRLLGLPASKIEEQMFSGRRGRLVLLPPPSNTLATRISRTIALIGGLGEAWRGVARQQRELEASLLALQTSRHELQQLIERLPDGVLIHQNGVIRWGNPALLAIFGVRELESVVGRNVLDFMPAEDRATIALAMQRAANNQVSDTPEVYRLIGADGVMRRIQAGTAQMIEFEGESARLIVLRDITEQHRLREQAAIADRLASIGALAAGVAHEINNPLTYVQLHLELASREVATLGNERRALDIQHSLANVREGVERVLRIVGDLKVLSRVHDEPNEAIDVNAALDSTLELAQRAISAKAQIVRSYGPIPPALAPRGKLGQVFLNLLTNAVDAIPDGAPLEHQIRVASRRGENGHILVEISDTGCGIAPDIRERIFDAFFTTKPVGAGTGLGLSMCHRIVSELGGELTFESAPGATTFRVSLPAAPPACRDHGRPQASEPRERAKHRVLVVDDEPALLAALRRMFAGAYDVVTAAGVREALDILRDDKQFDAVITDLMMAEQTGIDLYEAVQQHYPGLERRFLFMTGGAFTQRARAFLATVSNPCLEKPFDSAELSDAIDAVALAAP